MKVYRYNHNADKGKTKGGGIFVNSLPQITKFDLELKEK